MKSAPVRDPTRPEVIEEAGRIIRQGGLVAFPTETVYGLGADACNPRAVALIFEAKQRPAFDPLIVHVLDSVNAAKYGNLAGDHAQKLMSKFWPGPLTIVVDKTALVPSIVTAGLDTVAIRVPSHPVALSLLRCTGRPIAAPSANLFGYVSPTEARHVAAQLGHRVDLILDGGPCSVGIESTIVSLTGGRPSILRAGGIAPDQLEAVIGPIAWATAPVSRPIAPGQLTRHYATHTPLQIVPRGQEVRARPGERIGLISLTEPEGSAGFAAVEVLSEGGDLREAAANFFAALQRLDGLGLDRLVAWPVPEHDLGIAIMDRLRRCAVADPGRGSPD